MLLEISEIIIKIKTGLISANHLGQIHFILRDWAQDWKTIIHEVGIAVQLWNAERRRDDIRLVLASVGVILLDVFLSVF